MTLIVLAVVVAAVLGFAFRGSFQRFGRPPLQRNGFLAFAALAQITALLALHPGVYAGWLGCGAAALVAYARLNRGRPGLLLAAAGLLLNVLVIFVNWGMPVSLAAAERAGVPVGEVELGSDPLHPAVDGDTLLPWLTESIPLALPLRPAVASPGDLLAAAGAAVFIFTGLTGRGRLLPPPRAMQDGRKRKKKKRSLSDRAASSAGTDEPAVTVASGSGLTAASGGATAVEDEEIGAAADAIFAPQRTAESDGGLAVASTRLQGLEAGFGPVDRTRVDGGSGRPEPAPAVDRTVTSQVRTDPVVPTEGARGGGLPTQATGSTAGEATGAPTGDPSREAPDQTPVRATEIPATGDPSRDAPAQAPVRATEIPATGDPSRDAPAQTPVRATEIPATGNPNNELPAQIAPRATDAAASTRADTDDGTRAASAVESTARADEVDEELLASAAPVAAAASSDNTGFELPATTTLAGTEASDLESAVERMARRRERKRGKKLARRERQAAGTSAVPAGQRDGASERRPATSAGEHSPAAPESPAHAGGPADSGSPPDAGNPTRQWRPADAESSATVENSPASEPPAGPDADAEGDHGLDPADDPEKTHITVPAPPGPPAAWQI